MFETRKYLSPFWKEFLATCQEHNVLFSDVYSEAMKNLDDCPFCVCRSPLTWQSDGQCRVCDEFLLSEEDVWDFVK